MEGKVPFEKEILSENQAYNEYILVSLRTVWGIDLKRVKEGFSPAIHEHFLSALSKAEKNRYLKKRGGKVCLTPRGKLFADKIASDLFLI